MWSASRFSRSHLENARRFSVLGSQLCMYILRLVLNKL
uniref:Uncharacterized protein n=1 Tax=Rhizophora mucronata TaxID=61149 RepID=A0A2P2QGB9_RHIMU